MIVWALIHTVCFLKGVFNLMANQNGQPWQDQDGHLIQAHGGCIIAHENTYYWYGENKDAANVQSDNGLNTIPFVGISCYESTDLQNWQFKNNVLTVASDKTGTITKDSIVERPKVLFNEKHHNFVMWAHYDTANYQFAGCIVATSASATGPFTVQHILRPNQKDSRDMTLYQDGDKAYLVHSSDMNKTIYFSELTDDYLNCTGFMAKVFEDQEREAPTILHQGAWYFMITSGTTGWSPNPALFSRSHFLFSGQKLIDNPCEGPMSRTTYDGQPAYIFTVDSQPYLLMDHWKRYDLKHSGYSILPIKITGNRQRDIALPWTDEPFGGLLRQHSSL
ncbi:glycoside hydrolase family 43 protein [Lacticaseibacillus chiayiensis]|uniref:glycoside hydrolase family 43 protein n=1 Tax=Lacticaseibacillus chiayiensis TaxID=2100821 RepID=UPI00192D7335|nr:glycoside hydrolase family 43 protein [Lacticaseibacillus chiayiensis]QVI34562.1 family 43 glycosylhydrolase [Lacticaseibacillus chiayiensis]